MNPQHVFLILDPNFGEQVVPLSTTNPVWIVDSPQNTPVVHRLCQEHKAGIVHNLFLTLFQNNTDSEDLLSDILIAVNEHHGEASFAPEEAYTQLTTIGILPTSTVKEDLADVDLYISAVLSTGFIASKMLH